MPHKFTRHYYMYEYITLYDIYIQTICLYSNNFIYASYIITIVPHVANILGLREKKRMILFYLKSSFPPVPLVTIDTH